MRLASESTRSRRAERGSVSAGSSCVQRWISASRTGPQARPRPAARRSGRLRACGLRVGRDQAHGAEATGGPEMGGHPRPPEVTARTARLRSGVTSRITIVPGEFVNPAAARCVPQFSLSGRGRRRVPGGRRRSRRSRLLEWRPRSATTAATTTTTAPGTRHPGPAHGGDRRSVTIEAHRQPLHAATPPDQGRHEGDLREQRPQPARRRGDRPAKLGLLRRQDKFDPGDKATFTFAKPGTYAYYCSLHATATAGSMRGVITVTP